MDKAYAIQAGRELRILVNNDEVDDEGGQGAGQEHRQEASRAS